MADLSVLEGIRARRSVRGFLPDRVPQEVLDEVFGLAQWSPSGTNIQPWQTFVASGEPLHTLRAEFTRRAREKVPPTPDYTGKSAVIAHWKDRRRDCAKVLYDAMGIDWEDKAGRAAAGLSNFEMFDAPHVAFLGMHENFGMGGAWDVGMYAQTLMLAMTARGIGSCAQGTMAHYPDLVRETLGIDPSFKILFGISFGYEDTSVAANEARTERAPLADAVSFYG